MGNGLRNVPVNLPRAAVLRREPKDTRSQYSILDSEPHPRNLLGASQHFCAIFAAKDSFRTPIRPAYR